MLPLIRRAFVVIAMVAAAVGFASPARADANGLQLTLRGTDALHPVMVLTNRGSVPCRVVAGPLGTLTLTVVEQGGAPVTPIGADGSIDESLPYAMKSQLRTLGPGESADVPLRVLEWGTTGHVLQTVAWSSAAGAFATFYPIRSDQPLRLAGMYAVPTLDIQDGPALCASASGAATVSGTATGTAKRPDPMRWILIGAAALLVVVLLLGLLLVRRRLRRTAPTAAGIVVVVILASLVTVAGHDRAAYATVYPTPGLKAAWDACSQILHSNGGDPADILPTIDDPNIQVDLSPGAAYGGDYGNGEYGLSKNHMLITWNINDFHEYKGTGGFADPCDALYHELYHAYEHAKGSYEQRQCVTNEDGPTGLSVAEVRATRAQNKLRAKLGRPARDYYGDKPMPRGECLPPPDPDTCHDPERDKVIRPMVKASAPWLRREGQRDGCGDSNGDPHLRTFDGLRYDFQAAGEFVLTRDPAGGFEIQVRQQPPPGQRLVTVNTAVAMTVGTDRVEIQIDPIGPPKLLIGGTPKSLSSVKLPGGGGVAVVDPNSRFVVFWPDGSVAKVTAIGRWGLRVAPEPAPAHDGKLEGLLGDLDGKRDNDVRPRGGTLVAKPTFDALYPALADSWRVEEKASLFTYPPGKTTRSYVDRSIPDREARIDTLPQRAAAELICRRAGVSDPDVLAACILDVALTGQPDFAVAAAASQSFAAGRAFEGTEWTVHIAKPGDTAQVTFDATAGQKVFVDVPSASLPDQCGLLSLRKPDNTWLAGGCVIAGNGFIDGTVLPISGTYTIVVDPSADTVGDLRLRLIPITDQQGTIEPDGAEVAADVNGPGVVSRFSFAGTAGQKVFLDVPSSTLPDQCGLIAFLDPAGNTLGGGCIIGGKGFVDATVLPVTGRYTVILDPISRNTGQARLRLISDIDQRGTTTVDGPQFVADIAKRGTVASFSFSGTAGQRIVVDATESTLPDACGLLQLRAPDNAILASGCIISGTGGISAVALPTTGTYTLVVDPYGPATGTARLRVHT